MKKTAVVFSHAHWDVEWYMPMRSFRFWLVEALDRLIEICQRRPDFRVFMMDGQVAPIDLYLAVRPEKEQAIRELIRGKRLSVGPFYTQFDEWLISPESMVRNCLHGMRRGKELGGVMQAGYLPDNFGHPPQLPQILSGFGLDNLIFMRGMPDQPQGMGDEFYWEGMDGTKTLCIHLPQTYGAVAALGGPPVVFAEAFHSTPYGDFFFDYHWMFESSSFSDAAQGAKRLIASARAVSERYPSGVIPIPNGCDQSVAQEHIAEFIRQANKVQDEIRFVHGDCAEMVRRVKESNTPLPTFKGELWGARYQYILTGTLTTRCYIKQENFRAETLLEKYAEPLAALSAVLGKEYPTTLLDEAWRLMFSNHAHDSIHGSSADVVHLEMMQRFAAARQIAVGICHDSLEYLGARRKLPADGEALPRILVYNPANLDPGYAPTEVWLDNDDKEFAVTDDEGTQLPTQIVENPFAEIAPKDGRTCPAWPSPKGRSVLFLSAIAPHELRAFSVKTGRKSCETFRNTDTSIENEFLRVRLVRGAINIFCKDTGQTYKGLGVIEEDADGGDGWDYSPTWGKTRVYRSSDFPATSRLIENGPVRSTLLVETRMRIPHHLDGERRSRQKIAMPVTIRVSLYRGVQRVDVSVAVDNQAEDHRLRLVFPTGVRTQTVKSQGHYGIVERPLRNPSKGENWLQPPPQTFHFREWLAADDGRSGLAVACRGLYEYESRESPSGTVLYVTLLRGIGRMSRGNMKTRKWPVSPTVPIPEAQCKGPQRFDYSILPYRCGDQRAPFLGAAHGFLYPPIAHVVRGRPAESGNSPAALFRIEPSNLVLSAFKRAADNDSYILRIWENEGKATDGTITFFLPSLRVFETNLNEEPSRELQVKNGRLRLSVPPHKVVTLKLALSNGGKLSE